MIFRNTIKWEGALIMNAWAVTITLYNWLSPCKYWIPGDANSILINIENAVPIIPENKANIRYKVPMSFAFVENSHLLILALSSYPFFIIYNPQFK